MFRLPLLQVSVYRTGLVPIDSGGHGLGVCMEAWYVQL